MIPLLHSNHAIAREGVVAMEMRMASMDLLGALGKASMGYSMRKNGSILLAENTCLQYALW